MLLPYPPSAFLHASYPALASQNVMLPLTTRLVRQNEGAPWLRHKFPRDAKGKANDLTSVFFGTLWVDTCVPRAIQSTKQQPPNLRIYPEEKKSFDQWQTGW